MIKNILTKFKSKLMIWKKQLTTFKPKVALIQQSDPFSSIPESKLYRKIKSLLTKIKQKPKVAKSLLRKIKQKSKIALIQQFVLRG
jgi:hypothetical protein